MKRTHAPERATSAPPATPAPSAPGTGWENTPAPAPAVQRAVRSDRRHVRNTINGVLGR